jgi:ribosome-associated protein
MADHLDAGRGVRIPVDEVVLRVSRSSGPGGQHANVTSSRVEAIFDVRSSAVLSEGQKERLTARVGPVVRAVAQDARSQLRNRELALQRLAERLERGLAVQRPRRATKPTAGSRARRVETKRRQSERKRDRRRPGLD